MEKSGNGPPPSGAMSSSAKTAVFLGPSLRQTEAAALLPGALILPPIKRHDLARAIETFALTRVGIIDGEFFQSLAISPKEVVAALRQGCQIYGASSMGALRAAETWSLGTVGVGRIFELYRSGVIEGDDEVAVTYCPETYRPQSEALASLRLALADAVQAGAVSSRMATRLVARLRRAYFPDRSRQRLLLEARQLAPTEELAALRQFLDSCPDAKAQDARLLLGRLQADP
jgi:hypothetical protein